MKVRSKSKGYRSDVLATIHETMEALHKAGAIGRRTMRDFGQFIVDRKIRDVGAENNFDERAGFPACTRHPIAT